MVSRRNFINSKGYSLKTICLVVVLVLLGFLFISCSGDVVLPNVPSIPEQPSKPEQPDTPEKPSSPEQPSTPEQPPKPEQPEQPEQPETPETPETPDKPSKPDTTLNGIKYEYTNNAYKIVGCGKLDNTDIIIPETYDDGTNGEHPVVEIATKAFYSSDVTSVVIPDCITKIGEYAFQYTPLKSVTLGSGVTRIEMYTFSQCKKLATINIENIMEICKRAFENCVSLTSVVIPDVCTTVEESAFHGCSNIENLTIGKGLKSFGQNGFGNLQNVKIITYNATGLDTDARLNSLSSLHTIIIGENVKSIRPNFFDNCLALQTVYYNATNMNSAIRLFSDSSLKEVIIGDDVEVLPKQIFAGAKELTTVSFGKKIINIQDSAFDGCSEIKEISFPNSLKEIGGFAFRGTSITTLTIPESIIYVEKTAFQDCIKLKTLFWNAENYDTSRKTDYGGNIFENCGSLESVTFGDKAKVVPGGLLADIVSLKNVTLSDSIESIEYGAFWGCIGLTSVVIPKGVKVIKEVAFNMCENITSVIFSEGLEEIQNYAFKECKRLRSAILPNSLKSISNAFAGCVYISELKIGTSLESIIGDENFLDCTMLKTITVDSANNYFTSIDDVLYNKNKSELILYAPKKTDADFIVPNSVKSIRGNAFRDSINLERIDIPNSVAFFGENAFNGSCIQSIVIPDSVTELYQTFVECMFLESVTIGKNVETIGLGTFDSCVALKNIIVDGENQNYSSIDGNLYNKSGNNLIVYALGKENEEFVIKSSIIKIDSNAFVGADGLFRIKFENKNNWYVSINSDMSGATPLIDKLQQSGISIDDSEQMAQVLCDTDNLGMYYLENRTVQNVENFKRVR